MAVLGAGEPQDQAKEAGRGEMNTLRGLGAVALLGGVAYAVTRVTNIDQLMLGITIGIVAVSVVTYVASSRLRRKDRRTANGRAKPRRSGSRRATR